MNGIGVSYNYKSKLLEKGSEVCYVLLMSPNKDETSLELKLRHPLWLSILIVLFFSKPGKKTVTYTSKMHKILRLYSLFFFFCILQYKNVYVIYVIGENLVQIGWKIKEL